MSKTLWQAVSEGAQLHIAGDEAGARRIHRELVEALPDLEQALDVLGETARHIAQCEAAGQWEAAYARLDECLGLLPDDQGVLDHAARVVAAGAAARGRVSA